MDACCFIAFGSGGFCHICCGNFISLGFYNQCPLLLAATFAVGKNKKKVKKKLAKQDFDFLYDKKKGWLYFNENGADKGFGDGGIIAILKGTPELTSGNFGNDFTKDTSGIIPNG